MTGFGKSKIHLLDAERPRQHVSICGMVYPTYSTTDPDEMTCRHCLIAHKRRSQ